jgi:hypothetical protein
MRRNLKINATIATDIAVLCILLFSMGCGTSSSYSVHTIPKDISGTWDGNARSGITAYHIRMLFVQTGDNVTVAYQFEDETITLQGTYQSGILEATNADTSLHLSFLLNTATGTINISDVEYSFEATKQQ